MEEHSANAGLPLCVGVLGEGGRVGTLDQVQEVDEVDVVSHRSRRLRPLEQEADRIAEPAVARLVGGAATDGGVEVALEPDILEQVAGEREEGPSGGSPVTRCRGEMRSAIPSAPPDRGP